MGKYRIGIFAVLLALFTPLSASAQSNQADPSDVWWKGFVLFQEGSGLEQDGNLLGALNKYNEARGFFDHVARDFPEWYPDVVNWRRRVVREKADQIKLTLRGETPAGIPSLADSGAGASPAPAATGGQSPLPAWDPEMTPAAAPNAHVPTPPTPPASPNPVATPNAPINPAQPAAVAQAPVATPGSPSLSGLSEAAAKYQREFNELIQRLDMATRQNEFLQQEMSRKESENAAVLQQLKEAQQKQEALAIELAQVKDSQAAMSDSERVTELKAALATAVGQLKEATQLNRRITEELEAARSEIVMLKAEREKLTEERDELKAILATAEGDGMATIVKLTEANEALQTELDAVRAEAKTLAREKGDRETEVSDLKQRIVLIEQQREKLLENSQEQERRIQDLNEQLRQITEGLVDEESLGQVVSAELKAENELLRGIVLRQLRRQAQLKQTREMLVQELSKRGNETQDLVAYIEDMAAPAGLTEAERGLFREPEVRDIVSGTEIVVAAADLAPGTVGEQGVFTYEKLEQRLNLIQKAAQLDFSEGRLEDAEAHYNEYLQLKPDSAECLCNLAVIKIRTRKMDEAREILNRAIDYQEESASAYYLLGVIYLREGELDKAYQHMDQSITFDPHNAEAHNDMGFIASEKGWNDKAEFSFKAAIEARPDFAEAHFNLSILYAGRSDAEQAEKHYLKAVHLGAPRDAAMENFLNS